MNPSSSIFEEDPVANSLPPVYFPTNISTSGLTMPPDDVLKGHKITRWILEAHSYAGASTTANNSTSVHWGVLSRSYFGESISSCLKDSRFPCTLHRRVSSMVWQPQRSQNGLFGRAPRERQVKFESGPTEQRGEKKTDGTTAQGMVKYDK